MSDALKAARLEMARRELAKRQAGGQLGPTIDAAAEIPNPDGTFGQPPEGFITDPNTGAMTSRELMKNNIEPTRMDAVTAGGMQGYTMNLADEAIGAGSDYRRENARAHIEAAREDYPGTYIASNIAGAVLSPVNKVLPAAKTIKGGAATGGGIAAAEGFGDAEGGFTERLKGAGKSGATGFITAGLTSSIIKGATPAVRRAFGKAEERPSVESLREAKNAAYQAVRESGEKFDSNDTLALYQRVKRLAQVADMDDIADPQSAAALRTFERRAGEGDISLSRLDRLRQSLWDRYNRGEEPLILDMIGEIDKTIAAKGDASDLMAVAREANSRFAKTQLLDNAFNRAKLQTAATGSGGNILNKYKQAVVSILTKPHESKWFTPDELKVMEDFVYGSKTENNLRRMGKMSPTGNGLMQALNLYAISVNPAMSAATAAGAGAKVLADKSGRDGAENLLAITSTGAPLNRLTPSLRGPSVGAGALGHNALNLLSEK